MNKEAIDQWFSPIAQMRIDATEIAIDDSQISSYRHTCIANGRAPDGQLLLYVLIE